MENDRARVAGLLRDLGDKHASLLPSPWIGAMAKAVDQGRYDGLSEPFKAGAIVGPAGHLLVVGPYTQRRSEGDVTRLSGLFGQAIVYQQTPGVSAEVEAIQRAPLRQPVIPVLPIRGIAGCGNLGGEEGEAFIVPDGWGWTGSTQGLAINDMKEQLRRFEISGRRCIERIFDADTAAFLLAPMDASSGGEQVRHRSYDLHDVGHVAGLGLAQKVAEGLLPGFWYRAVEEWRADGVAFEVGARLMSEQDAAHDLASNFCVRFGVDAHRPGGLDQDQDVACILLMLDRLLRDGGLKITGGRLALTDLSYKGLIRAFEGERYDTVDLTRRELATEHSTGILRLYGSVPMHPSTAAILEGLVREPCRGFFSTLR